MEGFLIVKALVAFVAVIGLMYGCAWLLKKFGVANSLPIIGNTTSARLKMVEMIPIDNSRRLVLLRKDDQEYLMFLGNHSETVLETAKAPEKPKKQKAEHPPEREYADIL